MDLTKNLASWRELSSAQWIATASRYLPSVLVAVLVIAIAHRAAGLTWRLLETPAEQGAVPAPALSPGASSATASSYEPLRGWKPFGEPPAPGAPADALPINAPETTLSLTLWGTNGANREEAANAQISSGRATQFTYFVGDTIDNASGAVLYAVFPDHVILDRGGGRYETLSLPDSETVSRAAARGAPRRLTAAPQPAPQPSLSQAAAVREALSDAAVLLTDVIRPMPHAEGGRTIGYRLQPAQDEEAFRSLGFEPGDVLIEVNGLRLDDPQNAAQVFAALGEATQANVIVQRDDQRQALVIDIGQVQRLLESRQ